MRVYAAGSALMPGRHGDADRWRSFIGIGELHFVGGTGIDLGEGAADGCPLCIF